MNIARKAVSFMEETTIEIRFDIARMWPRPRRCTATAWMPWSIWMGALAADVCRRDDEGTDQARDSSWSRGRHPPEPESVRPLMRLLAVSRNLERIADCATNIAEDVIYMSEGRIIRHNKADEGLAASSRRVSLPRDDVLDR